MLQVSILGSGLLILQKWGVVIDRWQIRSGQNLKIGRRQIPQWVPKPKESVPPRGGGPERTRSCGQTGVGLPAPLRQGRSSRNRKGVGWQAPANSRRALRPEAGGEADLPVKANGNPVDLFWFGVDGVGRLSYSPAQMEACKTRQWLVRQGTRHGHTPHCPNSRQELNELHYRLAYMELHCYSKMSMCYTGIHVLSQWIKHTLLLH